MDDRLETGAGYRSAGPAQAGRLRGLLFDKDGTLFDFHATWSAWTEAVIRRLARGEAGRMRALAAALDFDLEARRFAKSSPVIAGTLEVVVRAVARTLPEARPAGIRQFLLRRAAEVHPVPAVPLPPLLDGLRAAGYRLGVATNDAESATRAQLAEAGVLDRFDFVAGYDSGYGGKPEPGMPAAFCRALGLAPAEAAMIGDSAHDLHAGRAAGLLAVAVLSGPADARDLAPHADAVIGDVGELPGWLAARDGAG